MKPSTPNFTPLAAAAILLAAIAPSFAQTTATTDPVGFMTLNVAGGTGTTAKLTITSLGLTNPTAYSGSAETATGGTSTIIDADATSGYGITVSASSPYYVEITSGSAAGTTYDISSISGTTINLAQSLANSVAAGVTFKIRAHWTIGTVFGVTNSAGLTGGTVLTADTISIYNGSGYDSYYYKTSGLGGTGWRKTTDSSTPKQDTVIYPDDGLVISRKAASAVPVVVTGAVKIGQTSFPVQTGLNVLTNPNAAEMTLNSCGLYTTNAATGVAGGTLLTADQVSLWNGTGYDTYYYKTSGLGGTGWRNTNNSSTDAGPTSIPAGAAVIIKRGGAAFNWIIPQHPATL